MNEIIGFCPICKTILQEAPGIGPYCPNLKCDVIDDIISHCKDGLLPDGPICPVCGGTRAPSGNDGGSWVHYNGYKR